MTTPTLVALVGVGLAGLVLWWTLRVRAHRRQAALYAAHHPRLDALRRLHEHEVWE